MITAGMVWRKSSRSGTNSNCVEVAAIPGGHAMRDSKDPEGPMLRFPRESWGRFLGAVHAGQFDAG